MQGTAGQSSLGASSCVMEWCGMVGQSCLGSVSRVVVWQSRQADARYGQLWWAWFGWVRQSRQGQMRQSMDWRGRAVTAWETINYQKGGNMPAFTNKYSYRSGYRFKVPAQVVGETLEGLAQTGELTSARFLEVSRPEDAPTHNMFEWDDSVAAERYRLQQATVAINSVEVQIVNEATATVTPQAAFVNVIRKAPAQSGSFAPIEVALSDENMRNALLENALNELKAFRRKYSQLSELADVFFEIKKIERAS